jgi:hypothetical protein
VAVRSDLAPSLLSRYAVVALHSPFSLPFLLMARRSVGPTGSRRSAIAQNLAFPSYRAKNFIRLL